MKITYPLVVITWLDHVSSDDWLDEEERTKLVGKLAVVRTVGWLYGETDEAYLLTATICEDESFTGLITIAKGTTVSKTVIHDT
jgi:hypothetical protein